MISPSIHSILTFASICIAPSFASPEVAVKRQSTCPSVWTDVASDLQSTFVSDSTCTDAARQAIRLAFHDCFPGSCDGSVILANECTDRGENAQMVDICGTLGEKATSFNVSTADIIQFAAAIGIASCSNGPVTSFYAGRTDSSTANPENQLPGPNANATFMLSLFSAKGFSTTDLVALAGAHTIGKQLDGSAMDSTVDKWDSGFYTEVSDGSAPDALGSDTSLSNSSETSGEWSSVGTSSSSFENAFVPAMEKLSLLGNDKDALTDCSDVISSYAAGTLSQKGVVEGSDVGSEAQGSGTTAAAAASSSESVSEATRRGGSFGELALVVFVASTVFLELVL
ncbi:class II peroxidase [Lophiostoma macrostomum CBS 122681]|uniref:Peroxidase n=1 Tax=Lophiostoma macrostomum CBS 122681 TaxID=1314788 RepID=A0A6A6SMJ4_9PLEO|nr:class II peroxidase [Lophiostoma macrostomum CBS 122681]